MFYIIQCWLTSEYMQLASSFMQLVAPERRRNIVHFHCLFERKILTASALEWGYPYSIFFIWGDISSDIHSEITFYDFADASP